MDRINQARRHALDVLERDYGIFGGMVYLLDVIPLVEMLWADGQCQDAERLLIRKYLREHIAWLAEQAGGLEVVSEAQIDTFTARFIDRRPPEGLLASLRELACEVAFPANGTKDERKQKTLDYCLDIAAAAVAVYPYGPHERVEESEKAVLRDLFRALA